MSGYWAVTEEGVQHANEKTRPSRHDCLEPLGLSVTGAAKVLGVTRQALNNVVNEKSGVSPEMAIRLSKAFGSTPETWVRMQASFDLAIALKSEKRIRVERYEPHSLA